MIRICRFIIKNSVITISPHTVQLLKATTQWLMLLTDLPIEKHMQREKNLTLTYLSVYIIQLMLQCARDIEKLID